MSDQDLPSLVSQAVAEAQRQNEIAFKAERTDTGVTTGEVSTKVGGEAWYVRWWGKARQEPPRKRTQWSTGVEGAIRWLMGKPR